MKPGNTWNPPRSMLAKSGPDLLKEGRSAMRAIRSPATSTDAGTNSWPLIAHCAPCRNKPLADCTVNPCLPVNRVSNSNLCLFTLSSRHRFGTAMALFGLAASQLQAATPIATRNADRESATRSRSVPPRPAGDDRSNIQGIEWNRMRSHSGGEMPRDVLRASPGRFHRASTTENLRSPPGRQASRIAKLHQGCANNLLNSGMKH